MRYRLLSAPSNFAHSREIVVTLSAHRWSGCHLCVVGKLNAKKVEQPQGATSSFAGMALKDNRQLMLWLAPESGMVEDTHARP